MASGDSKKSGKKPQEQQQVRILLSNKSQRSNEIIFRYLSSKRKHISLLWIRTKFVFFLLELECKFNNE